MTIGNWIINAKKRDAQLAVGYKDLKNKSTWLWMSWSEYIDKVISCYTSIESLGIQPKDHVGIMSSTRWEWAALDLALLGSGRVVVPMYPNLSDDDLLYIINHSDIKILVIENKAHLAQIERIKSNFEKKIQILKLQN